MNEEEKREQDRIYEEAKQRGELFYPNAIIKDAVVALVIFLILVGLSAFFKAELQPPANPADASYIPRPEWYFLFLYEILKFFPGDLIVIGVIVLPAVVFLILFLLPWLDRSKESHPRKRPAIMALLTFTWTVIIGFTVLALVSTPTPIDSTPPIAGVNQQQASAGQALYLSHCSGCHGQYGEGGPNPNKPENIIPPISSHAFLTTFTDDTLFNIVSNGLPESGMSAFGQQNGGPLDPDKVDLLVSYIRGWQTNPPVVANSDTTSASEGSEASAAQGNAERGFLYFNQFACSSCHGQDGGLPMGPNHISIIDPTWLSRESDSQIALIIYQGFANPYMRSYRGVIPPAKMNDLLAWLRSHQRK